MSNQRNLKAFVRYDASGRVVAGSLVLRKNKPKVGRWEEILTYECCNPTTTTTTTADPRPRISETLCGPLLPYRELTIVNGTTICDSMIYLTGDFSGLPFTIYVSANGYIRAFAVMGNQAYPSGECTICGDTTTTTTTSGVIATSFNVNLGFSEEQACIGVPAWNLWSASSSLNNGTILFYDSQLTQPFDGQYGSFIKYQDVVYQTSGSTISNDGTSCNSLTTTTTTTTV